jgi:hypothetical protein
MVLTLARDLTKLYRGERYVPALSLLRFVFRQFFSTIIALASFKTRYLPMLLWFFLCWWLVPSHKTFQIQYEIRKSVYRYRWVWGSKIYLTSSFDCKKRPVKCPVIHRVSLSSLSHAYASSCNDTAGDYMHCGRSMVHMLRRKNYLRIHISAVNDCYKIYTLKR